MSVWRLTFDVNPGEVPVELRVRALLKRAWRTYRLRCVNMECLSDASSDADARVNEGEASATPERKVA